MDYKGPAPSSGFKETFSTKSADGLADSCSAHAEGKSELDLSGIPSNSPEESRRRSSPASCAHKGNGSLESRLVTSSLCSLAPGLPSALKLSATRRGKSPG